MMSQYTCRICGGMVLPCDYDGFGVCESCGNMQPVPKLDNQQVMGLLESATQLMRDYEYDKAIHLLLRILSIDSVEPEIYWMLALCRHGVEYVETDSEKKPTLHRLQYFSFLEDPDYLKTLEYANEQQKEYYAAQAQLIEQVRYGAMNVVRDVQGYDVFICYKDKDPRTERKTPDYALAARVYDTLTEEGFRVFFSAVTLRDMAGEDFEPNIFHALQSARVMLAVTTRLEYVNSVWVKNEWSRYHARIRQGEDGTIIPLYRNVDIGTLPKELNAKQGIDLSAPDAMELVLQRVRHYIKDEKKIKRYSKEPRCNSLLTMAFDYLSIGAWEKAREKAELARTFDANCPQCYMALLMEEQKIKTREEFLQQPFVVGNSGYYSDILSGSDESLKGEVKKTQDKVVSLYNEANKLLKSDTDGCYKKAEKLFRSVETFQDAKKKIAECIRMGEIQERYLSVMKDLRMYLNPERMITVARKYRCVTEETYVALKKRIESLLELGNYRDSSKLVKVVKAERIKYEIVKLEPYYTLSDLELLHSVEEEPGQNKYFIKKAKKKNSRRKIADWFSDVTESLRYDHPWIYWTVTILFWVIVISVVLALLRVLGLLISGELV